MKENKKTNWRYLVYFFSPFSYLYGLVIRLPYKLSKGVVKTKKQEQAKVDFWTSDYATSIIVLGVYFVIGIFFVWLINRTYHIGLIFSVSLLGAWIVFLILGAMFSPSLKKLSPTYKRYFYPSINESSNHFDSKGHKLNEIKETDFIDLTPTKRIAKMRIERKVLSTHMAIIGATGSGKTETSKHFLLDQARQKQPTIFIDGKGATELVDEFRDFCKKANQKFYVFRIDKEKGTQIYNGLSGTPNQIKDKLITLFDLGGSQGASDYFNTKAKNHLSWLIKALYERDKEITLFSLINNFDPSELFELAKSQKGLFLDTELKKMRAMEEKDLEGLYGKILELYNNTKDTMNSDGITIEQAISENAFLLFSLDSLTYQTLSKSIGRFIIQDIRQNAKTNKDLNKKTLIVMDEFNVFADNNVVDILNKGRSYQYMVILLFQSLADLSKVSMDFQEQVLANTITKIVMKIEDNKTKDYIIKMFGRQLVFKESFNDIGTELKYNEAQEEIISMETLNSFSLGQAICKTSIQNKPIWYTKKTQLGLINLKGIK